MGMRCFLSALLCLVLTVCFSQKERKTFKGIIQIEEYTSNVYTTPDSLLFYSCGHWEIEKYYKVLFKRIKKELKKSKINTEFIFEKNDSFPTLVESFEEIEYKNKTNINTICVIAIGNLESNFNKISRETGQTVFINKDKIMYYNLYMMIIDTYKDKILLKRKFSIVANEIFYSNNKNVARAMVQEIKIK